MKKLLFILLACPSITFSQQLPVRNEPRHHNVFENGYVRILDVFLAPGDTTRFHLHNTPSIFTTFTKTATGSEVEGGAPSHDMSVAGKSWYDSLVKPRFHRVWNEDTTWFHVMDIELTGTSSTKHAALHDPAMQLIFQAEKATGYRLGAVAGKPVILPPSNPGYLLLSTGETTVNYLLDGKKDSRVMQAAHYLWVGAGQQLTIKSTSGNADILLFQIR